ncbi:MAG TPA: hypothetical protein ENN41_07720 [Sediminispirochaeta sp.]|nr:hypothetical protein [Sediminispirochaeta sp.]
MIRQKRVDTLLRHHDEEHPVVSLYVNVEWPKKYASQLNSMVREAVQGIHENSRLAESELTELEKLLFRIETELKGRKNHFHGTKMLAIFADTQGFWEDFELPVRLPNRVVIDPSPQVHPIIALQDNFLRFLVLVSNSYKAKILTIQGHQFVEEQVIFTQEEAEGSNDEALKGFGEQHLDRSEREQLHRSIKTIAQTTFHTFKEGAYDFLILAAPERDLPLLKDNLHTYLQEKVIGQVAARPEEETEALLKKVHAAVSEWEKEREKKLLDYLSTEDYEGGKAVKGVGPSLKALMNGQVHTLAVRDGFARGGYHCPKDNYLDLAKKPCPRCGEQLVPVEDVVDRMVEETLRQNGEIRYVRYFPEELEGDGIAARLRFLI